MNIVYSVHAKQRMKEKGITELEIEHILLYPSEIRRSYDNTKEAIGKVNNREIRVAIAEGVNYIKIITVM